MDRKKFNKTAGGRVDEALKKFFEELVETKDGRYFANLEDAEVIKAFARGCQFSFKRGFESAIEIANDLIDQVGAEKARENVLFFDKAKKSDFEIH